MKIKPFVLTAIIMISMMIATATIINYLEGDIIPDSSPWSLI